MEEKTYQVEIENAVGVERAVVEEASQQSIGVFITWEGEHTRQELMLTAAEALNLLEGLRSFFAEVRVDPSGGGKG